MLTGLPPFVSNSTLPQWLSAVFSAGIFAAVMKFVIAWRGQSLDAEEHIRDHYAQELVLVREEMHKRDENFARIERRLREMLDDEMDKHEECRRDRDALHGRVNSLESELLGIKRQIAQYSADKLIIMEQHTENAPHASASAHRVKRTKPHD